jgi:hypothetical protein
MLNATLSLGLVLSLICPICAQAKPNRRLLDGLFGPVHTSRREIASVAERDGATVEGPRTLVMSVEYNDDWTHAAIRQYRPNGSTAHKTLHTYDAEGRWLEVAYYEGESKMIHRSSFLYDGEGQLLEQVEYGRSGSVVGRILASHRKDENKAKVTEDAVYDRRNSLRSSSMNKTEENTGKAESAFYNADGSLANRSMVRRNEEGNWEHSEYKADGTASSRTVSISDGKGWVSEVQEYNGEGVLIRKQTYKHEYDSYGNWTKESEWHWESEAGKSILVSVRYRTITYY